MKKVGSISIRLYVIAIQHKVKIKSAHLMKKEDDRGCLINQGPETDDNDDCDNINKNLKLLTYMEIHYYFVFLAGGRSDGFIRRVPLLYPSPMKSGFGHSM